ncbi:MAG: hypothetical protein FJ090_03645 [Deltaproteobacteria bacterium]|nr:hypothetical protein [Deltaproteobacteria bacterium]
MMLILSLAWASPSFPAVVAEELAMPCTPSCILCHETAAGGTGTASQDFAGACMSAGMMVADDASMAESLATLEAEGTDTDGDGTPDIEELRGGQNPNPGGEDFCAVPQPQYGCFQGSAIVLGVVAGAMLRRRGTLRR